MRILVLDNYDSFTWNLVYLLRHLGLGGELEVHRNDRITLDEVERFGKVLLSPGPGLPADAGIMPELIRRYAPVKSILGVCLGHQCIGEVFGAKLHNLEQVLHGVRGEVTVTDPAERLFTGVPGKFMVGHYHSWVVDPATVGGDLKVTATGPGGMVMALAHARHDVRGLQFHPESVLTEHGERILANWIGG